MKELYKNAEMELVEFSAVDVIATSDNQGEAAGGWDDLPTTPTTPHTPGPGEVTGW